MNSAAPGDLCFGSLVFIQLMVESPTFWSCCTFIRCRLREYSVVCNTTYVWAVLWVLRCTIETVFNRRVSSRIYWCHFCGFWRILTDSDGCDGFCWISNSCHRSIWGVGCTMCVFEAVVLLYWTLKRAQSILKKNLGVEESTHYIWFVVLKWFGIEKTIFLHGNEGIFNRL